MPKTCVHLEKIEKMMRELEISRKPSYYPNKNKFLFYVLVRGGRGGGSCGSVPEIEPVSSGVNGSGTTQLNLCLNYLKNEIIHLTEQCDCEVKNNQQLVLRRSVETDLSVVRRDRDNLQGIIYSLERQIGEKNDLIKWGRDEVGRKNTEIGQLKTERDDYKNKWILSESEVRRINELFNNLQIENSRNKDKIRELKGELGQSREEYLNQKIGIKLEKLETLAQQLGINQGQIDNLKNAYQQLIEARRDFNQNNINAVNGNINNLRAALAVNPANKQKICRKCEKLVKLEIELNEFYQQQYEARQEVPPRN